MQERKAKTKSNVFFMNKMIVNGVIRPKLSIFLNTSVFFRQKRKRPNNIKSPSKKN
jgi:hypothetical protein